MIEDPWDSVLAAAREGADWAWDRIYRGLAPKVRGYLISMGAVDADDLLGEVWLQVARNIGTFTGTEEAFRSWVFVVAHHRVIDERRKGGRRPQAVSTEQLGDDWAGDVPSSEESALDHLGGEWVMGVLDTLSDDQREVLVLRIVADQTVEQVAKILGKSPGAVKALQRRALKNLRKSVEEGVPL